jgi:Sap, sulfolipid-1-addressing protein
MLLKAQGDQHQGTFRPGEMGGMTMVLDLVLIGSAIALDPLPLTAFLVVLPSRRGVRKGAAFVFGWLVSLAVVVTVTVLATGNNPPKSNTVPSLAALAVKIALGVVLVVIAVRHHRRMGHPKPKEPPKWQAHVDNMSPWFAMGLAPALQPWALIAAGAATVVEAKLSSWEDYPHAVPVLRPGLVVIPGHGDLRRSQARPEPGLPDPGQGLDRRPHRPGDHAREPDRWLLAHRR